VFSSLDLGLLAAYFVIVLFIGYFSGRKQTPDDFLICGRKLPAFQIIATISASWVGGGAIIAYGAYVYQFGVAALSVYVGFFFSMLIFLRFAPAIREKAGELKHLTLADYFSHEVGKHAGHVAAIVTGIGYLLFLVNQFIAGPTILSTVAGWSYEGSLLFSAFVILLYLTLGGMRSVVRTDVFQYIVMMLLFATFGIGMVTQTGVTPELLNPASMPPSTALAFLLYGLFTPFSSIEVWQPIYAAKDMKVLRRGLLGAGICVLFLGAAITLLGLAAKTAFPAIHPNEAIPYGMVHILPKGLLGLGLIVLFAAIMSTTDTIVFYLSSSIAKDYMGRVHGKLQEDQLQRVTRLSVILVTLSGVALAFLLRDIITVILTIAGILSGIVPPVLGSFFLKLKENAVIASLLSGCLYILVLLLTGNIEPDLAMGSLLVSTAMLFVGQKCFQ